MDEGPKKKKKKNRQDEHCLYSVVLNLFRIYHMM